MRVVFSAVVLLFLVSSTASAQSFVLQGSTGPTIIDSGYSMAAGFGFSPNRHLTFQVGVDRTHVNSQIERDARGNVYSSLRGGTVTLATFELRATIFSHDRVTPYAFGGVARGVSRPNDIPGSPSRGNQTAAAIFFGGGIHIPVREGLSIFGDLGLVGGAEGVEGILAYMPLRAGIAWRF